MKRRDWILIGAILALAAVLAAVFYFQKRLAPEEGTAVVTVTIDGELYGAYALSEDREVDIDTRYGHNHLSIRDGSAQVTEADCPDGICVQQGWLSDQAMPIVCMPHGLVISVRSGAAADGATR